ncbi:hypothetical protein ABZX92_45370 [Lentzea sp. NPDC006480]|uniref:hypothetical protein n=1 Tax=Lentzea sp. NPDC006480 TaxID=3157176 RepID=UPI0033AE52E8
MLLRLASVSVTNAFALLRLLSMSDQDNDAEILALQPQITVFERQLGNTRPRSLFTPPIGRSSRRCYTDFRSRRFVDSDCECAQGQCCNGTGVSSHDTTRSDPTKRPSRPRTIDSIRFLVLHLAW